MSKLLPELILFLFNAYNFLFFRFANCARYGEEQNLLAFQYQGELYYKVMTKILAHVELFVYYGDSVSKINYIFEDIQINVFDL